MSRRSRAWLWRLLARILLAIALASTIYLLTSRILVEDAIVLSMKLGIQYNTIAGFVGFSATIIGVLVAVASLLRPGTTYIAPLLYISYLAIIGDLNLNLLALTLAPLYLGHIYSYAASLESTRVELRLGRPSKRLLIITTLIALVSIVSIILAARETSRLISVILAHSEGDVRIFLENLSRTLLFKLLLAGFTLYLVWKAIDAITSLASITVAPRASILALYDARTENKKNTENLVYFKGRQNGFLREGLVLLFSLVFSPTIFPLMRNIVAALNLSSSGIATTIAVIVTYITGWILMRITIGILFDPLPITMLTNPKKASSYLILGLIFSIAILSAAYILGMNPLLIVESTVTGKPLQNDPFASLIGFNQMATTLEKYLEAIYKGSNAIVKYLWGG